MKTFYSIVYALITPETGEKISLGILLSDGENSIFRYSRLKLSIVHSMVSAEQGKFMSDYLHSLSKLSNPKDTIKVNLGLKFAESGKSLISESYIEYLSVYNQNILTYSKPVLIEMEVSTVPERGWAPKLMADPLPETGAPILVVPLNRSW